MHTAMVQSVMGVHPLRSAGQFCLQWGWNVLLLRGLLQRLLCRLHSIWCAGTVSRIGMTVPQYVSAVALGKSYC